MTDMLVREGTAAEINPLLAREHYLGPLKAGSTILVGEIDGEVVTGQVWRRTPTARRLPLDGSWLELSRWCLTPAAGPDAGSRFHAAAVKYLRDAFPAATTLVSYSDPAVGHTGTLYRACNWFWCPAWQRLRPPPSRGGDWNNGKGTSSIKDRWVFPLRRDANRGQYLMLNDNGAIRHWAKIATPAEISWAIRSLTPDLAAAAQELARVR